MPQKTLYNKVKKTIQKTGAANRHGKTPRIRKGKFVKVPKKAALLAAFKESKDLTAFVDSKNEGGAAAKVENDGAKFSIFKAPPVMASAQYKQEKKKQSVKDDF
eukprot:TRINITY_DN17834_c0_g3_i1.p2 TRINITY_DN17834_c0_g3~~TRINITY_DN17834_c0_g3_i1.p2  ORF type:complete len:104 (-),score=16.80 TRINITY_DN17834_c0_g3_i1:546-857(-)